MLHADAIAQYIESAFPGVETETNFGYLFFFCGAERKLPFATLATSDNDYDRVSALDREGVYRLNIGVGKRRFQSMFGPGAVEPGDYDFTALDTIMPHPTYAAQGFVCVLNPGEASFATVKELLTEAYRLAMSRQAARTADL